MLCLTALASPQRSRSVARPVCCAQFEDASLQGLPWLLSRRATFVALVGASFVAVACLQGFGLVSGGGQGSGFPGGATTNTQNPHDFGTGSSAGVAGSNTSR